MFGSSIDSSQGGKASLSGWGVAGELMAGYSFPGFAFGGGGIFLGAIDANRSVDDEQVAGPDSAFVGVGGGFVDFYVGNRGLHINLLFGGAILAPDDRPDDESAEGLGFSVGLGRDLCCAASRWRFGFESRGTVILASWNGQSGAEDGDEPQASEGHTALMATLLLTVAKR